MSETILAQASQARQQGDIATAISLAEEAADLAPENGHVISFLGYTYADGRAFDKARKSLRTAVDLSPDDAILRANLGQFLICAGAFDDAKRFLKKPQTSPPTILPLFITWRNLLTSVRPTRSSTGSKKLMARR